MLHHDTPCYTMLHHATPCYTMIHHGTPWYTMIHHDTPCYTMLHHATMIDIHTISARAVDHAAQAGNSNNQDVECWAPRVHTATWVCIRMNTYHATGQLRCKERFRSTHTIQYSKGSLQHMTGPNGIRVKKNERYSEGSLYRSLPVYNKYNTSDGQWCILIVGTSCSSKGAENQIEISFTNCETVPQLKLLDFVLELKYWRPRWQLQHEHHWRTCTWTAPTSNFEFKINLSSFWDAFILLILFLKT